METKNGPMVESLNLDELKKYKNKIVLEKGLSCEEQENRLFKELDDRKRILMELRIIKRKLNSDKKLFMLYNDFYNEILEKCQLIGLTKSVIPEIKAMIVQLDVACGVQVHLYSAIPPILNGAKEEKHAKR